jgi:hypothetical protein
MPSYLKPDSNLSCGHVSYFDPIPYVGDIVLCHRCDEYRTVVTAARQFRIACEDCNLARCYGRDGKQAVSDSLKHLKRHPTHRPIVTLNFAPIHQYVRAGNTIIDRLNPSPEKPIASSPKEGA